MTRYVFDAEPLVAFAGGEDGAQEVKTLLDDVQSDDGTGGFVSVVQLTEIRYIMGRNLGEDAVDAFESDLLYHIGLTKRPVADFFQRAAYFKRTYSMALGDAFATALAEYEDATLVIGGDDCFDDVSEVDIHRFRDGSS
jgi:PIN domain nuclease of toxin-antitoxin system